MVVRIPPVTDLAQHLAQVRLLVAWLGGGADGYVVGWWQPNSLVYAIGAVVWQLAEPFLAGRLWLMAIVAGTIAAHFVLAWSRGRSPEAAALAAVFVYGMALYWGFLPFVMGWSVFAVFWSAAGRALSLRSWLVLLLLAVLLYAAHALWFAFGCLAMAARVAVEWRRWRERLLQATAMLPAGLVSLWWYPRMARAWRAGGFDVASEWKTSIGSRLGPKYVYDHLFSGPSGALPFALLAGLVVVWLGLSLWRRPRALRRDADLHLLIAGALAALVYLLVPDKHVNTIFFSSRWLAPAAVFLLLALPAPRRGRRLAAPLAAVVVLAFALHTARTWHRVEAEELTGLEASVAAVTPGSRVLGLDFVKQSRYLVGRPFLQMTAWTEAVHGCAINFTFAEHASSLVRLRAPRDTGITVGLEWLPERVRPSDVERVDFVLVNATDGGHVRFVGVTRLKPVTTAGRWRLYRGRSGS